MQLLLCFLAIYINSSHGAVSFIRESSSLSGIISCLDQPGTTLHITFANFGRTSAHVCTHPSLPDTNICEVDPSSTDKVRALCEGTITCEITPNNSYFGDTCPNTYKCLEVNYECIPSGVKYICEDYTAPLSCAHKPGTTLDITAANYGRNSDTICVHRYLPSTGTCPQNPNALGIVQTLCQGMVSCDPLAENGIFTDTCPNVYKYLEIHCQCVCSNGLPCDGENEECDADGNCGCVDGFVRDQTGHCVEDCNPSCSENRVCIRTPTCVCETGKVENARGECVTCIPECEEDSDCRNKGEICSDDNLCGCPSDKKLFRGVCRKRGQLGGWCTEAGRCFGRGVKCNRATNTCTCIRECAVDTICLKRKAGHTHGHRTGKTEMHKTNGSNCTV